MDLGMWLIHHVYVVQCIHHHCVHTHYYYRWVSGVGSVYHPQVWTACVSYIHSISLSDRVWGDGGGGHGFLLLVYVHGTTQPSYWQCTTKTDRDGLRAASRGVPYEIACGDASVQVHVSSADIVITNHSGSIIIKYFPRLPLISHPSPSFPLHHL